jgi:hypothetical protein
MKYLALAILTAFVLGIIIYVATAAFLPAEFARGLAVLPLAGFNHIADALEQRDAKQNLTNAGPPIVPSLAGFAISWPLLVVYGTLTIFAIIQGAIWLAGAIIGVTIAAANIYETRPDLDVLNVGLNLGMALIVLPLNLLGGYLVGRWIGIRSMRNGVAIVLVSVALASVLYALWHHYLNRLSWPGPLPSSVTPSVPLSLSAGIPLAWEVSRLFRNLVVFSISGLVGCWRGQKMKLSRYMQYLLSILPNDSRNAVVELAFDEALRVSTVPKGGAG